MNEREQFYHKIVQELIPDRHASVLICGGGLLDKNIFAGLGFLNVTLSNLDTRNTEQDYAPFRWKYENAENLSFSNEAFDYVVIHAAIHHASSPHKVLTEMYRVAKKGVLAFEARDSLVMRLLEKYGITQVYEHAAVFYNDCQYGGVNNTDIPNYIYRWTEREIEKTIQAYAPFCKHQFHFRYGTAFPATPALEKKSGMKMLLLKAAQPLFRVFAALFPRQQNLFAFYIKKPSIPESLFPWLTYDDEKNKIEFNRQWGEQRYQTRKNP